MSFDRKMCSECVRNGYLRQEIKEEWGNIKACDYCDNTGPTIEIGELAQTYDNVIDTFFELSSMTNAVLNLGRDPDGDERIGLLKKLTGVDGAALDSWGLNAISLLQLNSGFEHLRQRPLQWTKTRKPSIKNRSTMDSSWFAAPP